MITTMSSTPEEVKPVPNPNHKGVVGLQNMGNTCYANSSIQLLRSVPELNALVLRETLEEVCADKEGVPTKILLGYQDLIRSMWGAYKPAYVRPLGFLTVVRDAVRGTVYDNFGRPTQNDSHEYLIYLLDKFHEALNEGKASPSVTETAESAAAVAALPMTEQAALGWKTFAERHTSPIVDLFFGMIRKTVECQGCMAKSYRWETFNVFKIPCKGVSLQEWFKAECAPTDIEDYACEPCGKAEKGRQKAQLYSHVWRLPSSLFLAIKRFAPDGRKDMSVCPYDGAPISFAEHFAPESDHESKLWRYECRGIADHHSMGMGGGHYSAQIAHPVTNEWWWIDDGMSQAMPGARFGSSNYVLYMRRIMVASEA